jgi:hypothetical protein
MQELESLNSSDQTSSSIRVGGVAGERVAGVCKRTARMREHANDIVAEGRITEGHGCNTTERVSDRNASFGFGGLGATESTAARIADRRKIDRVAERTNVDAFPVAFGGGTALKNDRFGCRAVHGQGTRVVNR